MSKKKPKIILKHLTVESVAAEGRAIARYDNRVIFIPMVIPGDVVDIRIIRKRKSYWEGQVVQLIHPSPDRQKPVCAHFGVCGGCKWQMLPYGKQLQFKEQQVTDQLSRIGKMELPGITPIIGAEQTEFYRNKLEFTFAHRRWFTAEELADAGELQDEPALGFHVRGRFDKVVDIAKCWLQPDPSNAIRNEVKTYALSKGLTFFNLREQKGFLRNLIIRTTTTGEVMVVVIMAEESEPEREDLLEYIKSRFSDLTSLMWVINPKANDTIFDLPVHLSYGRDHLIEKIENLSFKIGPKSFFQAHTQQATRLYQVVREMADLSGEEVLYDLYTGTGTIALFLASRVKKVVGIDSVPEAVTDARENAELNHVVNASFFSGDIKEVLDERFIQREGVPDVVVLDPPRAGIHQHVVEVLRTVHPARIIYVSCNPATQARDLALMADLYRIVAVQPVDMFPHTHHVENIIRLDQY